MLAEASARPRCGLISELSTIWTEPGSSYRLHPDDEMTGFYNMLVNAGPKGPKEVTLSR